MANIITLHYIKERTCSTFLSTEVHLYFFLYTMDSTLLCQIINVLLFLWFTYIQYSIEIMR